MTASPRARMGDRSLFPDLNSRAYLAHAAISPLSLPVREAIGRALQAFGGGVQAFPGALATRQRLRETLATLIGARAEDLSFVGNTTLGVLDIAFGHPWKSGDRVVLFEGEFPANTTPWLNAARSFDLEPVWVSLAPFMRSEEEGVAALTEALSGGASLVAVSAVQFQTGLRMPLRRIADVAHAHGARLFVDAIQALGAVPIDIDEGFDYLSAGSHKWLMGPDGCGVLYISPDAMAHIEPRLAGWLSHEDPLAFLVRGAGHLRYDRPIRRRADLFEQGMQASLSLTGLESSVAILAELGVERIFEHIDRYLDTLEGALVGRGWTSARCAERERRSGILSVRPPNALDVIEVHHRLEAHGIRGSLPDGWLRFAPHWPNSLDEVETVVATLDEVVSTI